MTRHDAALTRRCLATVGLLDVIAVDGAQNVVVVGDDRVWRFPRRDPVAVHDHAARCTAAASLGLGAPEVLDVVPGDVGTAHVVLRRLAGTPLLTARGQTVADGVAEALERLRSARQWPWNPMPWDELWMRLSHVAEQQYASLSQPREMLAAAQHAAAVAATAPLCVLHGDLASDNLLIRGDGGFAGLLDWDSAVLGDPAMDTAAVLHVISTADVVGVRSATPAVDDDLRRFDAYAATWPLQAELWRSGLMPLHAGGTGH